MSPHLRALRDTTPGFPKKRALALLWYGCVMLIGISLIMKVNRRDDDRHDKD